MNKKWKRLSHEIEVLKVKYRKTPYRPPFPDLKVELKGTPCGNGFGDGRTPVKTKAPGSKQFAVGHSHKQGLQLITPDALKNELQFMGGKKT